MGKYAVVKDSFVVNVIACNNGQIVEMMESLGADSLIDAIPYGLCIGDFWNGEAWTRNLNGVQVELELLSPEHQTNYNGLRDENYELHSIINAANVALKEGVDSIE